MIKSANVSNLPVCLVYWWRIALSVVALISPVGPALACGYENPEVIAAGALNFAFPDSLHVGTALWQARRDGLLPGFDAADLPTAPRKARTTMKKASASARLLLDRIRAAQAGGEATSTVPSVAMIFLGSAMWNRFAPGEAATRLWVDVNGPESGDLVLVTEPAVMRALLDGRMRLNTALERGLIRLYADDVRRQAGLDWLARLSHGRASL